MRHFCNRDKKRYKPLEMEVRHCDGCTMKNTCRVNHASKIVPKDTTIEEQFTKLG